MFTIFVYLELKHLFNHIGENDSYLCLVDFLGKAPCSIYTFPPTLHYVSLTFLSKKGSMIVGLQGMGSLKILLFSGSKGNPLTC